MLLLCDDEYVIVMHKHYLYLLISCSIFVTSRIIRNILQVL